MFPKQKAAVSLGDVTRNNHVTSNEIAESTAAKESVIVSNMPFKK